MIAEIMVNVPWLIGRILAQTLRINVKVKIKNREEIRII